MSKLDDLAERFSKAAANPPRLAQTKVRVPTGTMLPSTDGTGRRRPQLRVSAQQKQAQRSMITDKAIRDARVALTAQARRQLSP